MSDMYLNRDVGQLLKRQKNSHGSLCKHVFVHMAAFSNVLEHVKMKR